MRTLLAMAIVTFMAVGLTSLANAGDRHGHGPYDNWSWRNRQHQNYHRHEQRVYVERRHHTRTLERHRDYRPRTVIIERHDSGAAFIAGVYGGVLGGLLVDAFKQPQYAPPAPPPGRILNGHQAAPAQPNNPCFGGTPVYHAYTGEFRGCR